MMAAAQPFLSGAISKTVNMPNDVTKEDIADAYAWGWKLGLKALAIYRDGSKQSQPLNTKAEGDKSKDKDEKIARVRRERLPDTRQSITHKFSIAGHEGYINVGLYPDGRPGELFITMAKEGSTIGGLMDSFGTAISICLQYGVPLEVLVNKFSHTRFEPLGMTTNPDIRFAKSVVDYIFRWLGIQFMPGFREASRGESPAKEVGANTDDSNTERLPVTSKGEAPPAPVAATPAKPVSNGSSSASAKHLNGKNGSTKPVDADLLERAGVALKVDQNGAPTNRSEQFARFQLDAPSCDNCGSITVRNGNCYLCHNCGNSMGCS
jgi:ribonucleoside-diphosphate reductase alpha chain